MADVNEVLLHIGLMRGYQQRGAQFAARRAKLTLRLHHAAQLVVQNLTHRCRRQGGPPRAQGRLGLARRFQRGA